MNSEFREWLVSLSVSFFTIVTCFSSWCLWWMIFLSFSCPYCKWTDDFHERKKCKPLEEHDHTIGSGMCYHFITWHFICFSNILSMHAIASLNQETHNSLFCELLLQAPVFISFFFALRGMANLPIESFKTGGMLWFTDLTVPDPFYILPLITSVSLFCTLEVSWLFH